jgi:membrane protease YdiL (CAAX protease family)
MPDLPDILALNCVAAVSRAGMVNIVVLALSALGAVFLLCWLTGFVGPINLGRCPLRRNRLPVYLPFIHMAVWVVVVSNAMVIIDWAGARLPSWRQELLKYLTLSIIELVLIVFLVCFARQGFARRLKGFGLNLRTTVPDLGAAVINLISALPLVFLGIWLMAYLGRFFVGPDFKMQANEGLTVVTGNSQPSLRALMFVFLVLIAPIFEEMLFRGILQSVLRGLTPGPWAAIVITSVFFAVSHPWTHLPALFVLSCCMGYAYEKSGSLLRPIFIHVLFNAANITVALIL